MFNEEGIPTNATVVTVDVDLIVNSIRFENAHTLGYALFHSRPNAAKALMLELQYWIEGKDYVRESYEGDTNDED